MVLQDPFLFTGTILENIRYRSEQASLEEIEQAAKAVGAHELIKRLPDGYETMATVLRERGYDTGLFGKWHLGSSPAFGPNHFGFNTAYGSLAGGVDPYNHRYKRGEFSVTWHRNGDLVEERGHVTDLIVHEAREWIESRDRPWFCCVPFTAVHVPVKPTQEWLSRYYPEHFDDDPLKSELRQPAERSEQPVIDGIAFLEAALEARAWEVDFAAVATATGLSETDATRAVGLFNAYCARCHTAGYSAGVEFEQEPGSGAWAPALTQGRTVVQFPDMQDHIDFIIDGAEASAEYGVNGISGVGGMPGFGAVLSLEDIELIVKYERSM